MLDVALNQAIETMSADEIKKVEELEALILAQPQVEITTEHMLHAGMYARTIMVPAGVVLTGAIMKIATILIISGDFLLFIGGKTKELRGYNVFAGGPNRKQAGVALSDTHVTMLFPTKAKTIIDAEAEFTDDTDKLISRKAGAKNYIEITEGDACLAD